MNCNIIQRRLLALPEPADLPAGMRSHLDDCPACQETHRRLVQIERNIPHLKVPSSSFAQAAFLQQFRNEATVWERWQLRMSNLKRWQVLAATVAASLLLFFVAWSLAPNESGTVVVKAKPVAADKLLATLLDRNQHLALASSTRDQVETLAGLAEDLRGQSQPLFYYAHDKDGKESLKDLADWYGQVVRMSVARASLLPADQRRPVLDPIAKQLDEASNDAEQLAREGHVISAEHPLHTIAFSARNGKEKLDVLLRDEAAWVPAERVPARLRLQPLRMPTEQASLCRLDVLPAILAASGTITQTNGSPSPAVMAAEKAQRFQRNRRLIQSVVDNCLRLAEQSDLIHRSASCTVVADRLAEELQRAAGEQDLGRADELTRFLKEVLVLGVAFNLTTANAEIPVGDPREPEMLQIGDHVKHLAEPLEQKLGKVASPGSQEQWQKLVERVVEGRDAVYRSLKGRGSY